MKKIFTLFAALAMVMSMFAAAETVYFVNADNWIGTINAYAWTSSSNADWPGVAATKEAEQLAGCDVYSYSAEAGTYANVIFNNGSKKTADLNWTAGKYFVRDDWYTKEEALVKLGQPVEYESVYFVNVDGWSSVKIYTWGPEVGTWPGIDMKKETETIGGKEVWSHTEMKGAYFDGVIFNNGSGTQTDNLTWNAGKYYVTDGWYTKEEAEAKLGGGEGEVTPKPVAYYVVGTFNNWNNGDEAYVMTAEGNVYEKDLTLAAGEHMLKVTNGTWDDGNNWGYSNVSGTYEEVSEGTNDEGELNGNILITLAEETVVTVLFDAEAKKISFEGLTTTEPTPDPETGVRYVLMGVAGDWKTGIDLVPNPGNEAEYMLLGQAIDQTTDSVKVVTITDGEQTEWCNNVKEESPVEWTLTEDGHKNIVLKTGKYDFYYDVANDVIYIGASSSTAVDNVTVEATITKVIRDGQIYILRDGMMYSLTGQIVK